MTAIWRSGDFVGQNRPIARVMVQKANIALYRSGKNTFASLPFGMTERPKELPNVKSVSWSRDIDSDVASCTVELYNTAELPIGVAPTNEDFDQPGFYTPNRGTASMSSRWGHTRNEWAGLIVPDNVIHTYEGYGHDPNVCPEDDPHLVQTGIWIIDSVQMSASGMLVLSCRDFGRLLLDHIIMEPVIPTAFYPLKFKTVPKKSGIKPPQLIADEENVTTSGPNAPPSNFAIDPNNGSATYSWDPMPPVLPEISPLPAQYQGGKAYKTGTGKYYLRMPDAKWYVCTGPGQVAGVEYLYGPWVTITDAQVGTVVTSVVQFFGGPGGIEKYMPEYEAVGFRVYLNGTLQGYTLDETQTSVTIPRLMNGNVYYGEVAAIYQNLVTGHRYTTARSAPLFFSPRTSSAVAVDMFSVETGLQADGSVLEGSIRWAYVSDGRTVTWKVIVFADSNQGLERFEVTEATANGGGVASIPTGMGTLERFSMIVFPTWDSHVGPGGHARQTVEQQTPQDFYHTPAESEPEDPPAAEGRQTYTTTTSTGSTSTSTASPQRTPLAYNASSNTPYVGDNGAIYGHRPSHAFDADGGTYWLSVGNSRPDAPYAYEWVEGKTNGPIAIPEISVDTPYKNLYCYVSVFANGGWVKHNAGDIIPYDPNHSASAPNGANIPYVHAQLLPNSGTTRIKLRQSYANVTRVRVTFHNLQNSGLGTYPYRAAVREFIAYTEGAPTTTEQNSGITSTTAEPSTIEDSSGATIKNATIVGGAGDNPGEYEDYTDIVKLLCAWGGFFWAERAKIIKCDGSEQFISFGVAPYNLGPNIDPVLGGFNDGRGGRVWGDFEVAGTAGVVDLKADIFDKKPLMEGINYVKEILGFLFYVDEEGGVVFRSPNIFSIGNWTLNRSGNSGRTADMVVIDELQTLFDITATINSQNVREHIFIASVDSRVGGGVKGWNPNPSGWRRVAGWTDQGFATQEECELMADMVALRQLFTYRTDSVTIPGYPRIQINDQVRINERVTGEAFIHYVKGISSRLDMETGEWTYDLGTHWLGEKPFSDWAFDPSKLSPTTQRYLEGRGISTGGSVEPPTKVPDSYEFPEYS